MHCVRTHAYTNVHVCFCRSGDQMSSRRSYIRLSVALWLCGILWHLCRRFSSNYASQTNLGNTRERRSDLWNKTFSCADYHQLPISLAAHLLTRFVLKMKSSMLINEDALAHSCSDILKLASFISCQNMDLLRSVSVALTQRVCVQSESWRQHFFKA